MNWSALPVSLVLAASSCGICFAQTAAPPVHGETPAVATTIDAEVLSDLPTSDNLFSVLETTQPSVTSDRFSGSGLYTGQASRIGSFFSSWSETRFRIGDADISDPRGTGAPMLLPDLGLWDHVDVTIGMMPADLNAPGLEITLDPLRPTATWTHTVSATAGLPTSAPATGAPYVARLNGFDHVNAIASGPLLPDAQGTPRLGAVFGASWTRGSQFNGAVPASADATLGSAFANLVFKPSDRNQIQTIGWVQTSTTPFDAGVQFNQPNATTGATAGHVQASWERRSAERPLWRLYANYTQRNETPNYNPSIGAVFDDVGDDPISTLAFLSPTSVNQWSTGVRLLPVPIATRRRQSIQAGLEVGGARQRSSSFFSGVAGETVDNIVARIWQFNAPKTTSVRDETTVIGYVTDHIELAPRFSLDAGIRFDSVSGSAQNAQQGISWQSWLPRASMKWTIAGETKMFVGFSRSANRLPLDALAIGDPSAPTADISQWIAPAGSAPTLASTGALIARVGPGTGGDPTFSAIDPHLERPRTDELTAGFESHPGSALRLRLVGLLQRETNLLGLVDTGAPLTAYSTVSVPDPGLQLLNPIDDQILTVYNRLPSSFGQDRYLLTNPGETARSAAIEASGEWKSEHLVVSGGLSANYSQGPAANVGSGPLENEQDLIGDLYTDPNAATFSQGRLFTDRAYRDQTERRVPFSLGRPLWHHRPLSGRPAIFAPGAGAWPQPGSRPGARVFQRPLAVYLHGDGRYAASEDVRPRPRSPRRRVRRLQPPEHVKGSRRADGHGRDVSRSDSPPAAESVQSRIPRLVLG